VAKVLVEMTLVEFVTSTKYTF